MVVDRQSVDALGISEFLTIETMPFKASAPMSLKLAREQFTKDADKAWQHYQETGLHATSEEVFGWVDSWGISNEIPKPKCHV